MRHNTKHFKKLLALLLAICSVWALAACGDSDPIEDSRKTAEGIANSYMRALVNGKEDDCIKCVYSEVSTYIERDYMEYCYEVVIQSSFGQYEDVTYLRSNYESITRDALIEELGASQLISGDYEKYLKSLPKELAIVSFEWSGKREDTGKKVSGTEEVIVGEIDGLWYVVIPVDSTPFLYQDFD